MRNILFAFCLLLNNTLFAQSFRSPSDFLGYELGSRFTPHNRIVAYFEEAAKAFPSKMKLQQYGMTNEGRPLYIAVFSSEENLRKTEEIRMNNLRLAGLDDAVKARTDLPSIVWLSYNVHGNEASSSEVSMKMLYEILNGQNQKLNSWLQNTIVIIDPCLNPDGRERYINWFAGVSAAKPNLDVESREHQEPWPGGRLNHYYFDLNRDWVWQSQIESKARVAKYREWMPQVHCDFHEMGINDGYFFPPAAEPVHDAVTQWQKDFQVIAGKNHAKYFDANGWLYFTRQYYDLFYPSYGDTYPLFNGAIGMTYEQAGGRGGGLAVTLQNGDTLTLADRIQHHFVTGLSTIEAASLNKDKLVTAFKKYFDDSRAGKFGKYRSYVIRNNNSGSTRAFIDLCKNNGIKYEYSSHASSLKGYNYENGKEENVTIMKNDLVIDRDQPASVLLSVLLEPASHLADSLTYDITAWSVPYAFGLKTFGLAVKPDVAANAVDDVDNVKTNNAYAYIAPYSSMNSFRFMSALIQDNIKVRMTESAINYNDNKFENGSMIIMQKGNENKVSRVLQLAEENNIKLFPVLSGFSTGGIDMGSDRLHFVRPQKIALLSGDESSATAVGEVWQLFDQQLKYPITLLDATDLNLQALTNINTLIIADGDYKLLSNKESAADLRGWIRNGGTLIVMENAAKQVADLDWGLKLKKGADDNSDSSSTYANVRNYADREKQTVSAGITGAIYKLQLDSTHPVAYGYPSIYYTLKQNPNVYEFLKDGWNIAVLKKQNAISGFVGNRVRQNLKDGTLIGQIPAGKGSVIFFADDPIFRSFWEAGKLMFCNAAFFGAQ